MEIKAVIFDMDGVIIDSEPFHYKVNREIFKELNIQISDEEYSKFIGVSNKDMWSFLRKKYNLKDSVEELSARQIDRNINYLKENDEKPIEGIKELIKGLNDRGLKIGLASSSPMAYIELVLNKFGIDKFFHKKISGENLSKGKPHPDIYLLIAKELGVVPGECLVIEDSTNGVESAKKAGMNCIGFDNPNSDKQDLSGADIVVGSIREATVKIFEEYIR